MDHFQTESLIRTRRNIIQKISAGLTIIFTFPPNLDKNKYWVTDQEFDHWKRNSRADLVTWTLLKRQIMVKSYSILFDYRYDKSWLMSKLASSSLSTGAMGVILILLVRIVNNIPVCVWCWRQSNRCTKCENDLLAQIYTLTPICSLYHPFTSVTFYHSLWWSISYKTSQNTSKTGL